MELPKHEPTKEYPYLLEAALNHVDEAVLITTKELDPPGPQIVYANEGFCRMTGYAAEEVIGKTPRILQGPKTDRAELDRLRRCLSQGESFFGGEAINYRKDGSEFMMEWYIVPLRNESGETTHWMASQRDVTERRALEEQLRYQAFHDPLTDLPNRTLLSDRLEHALTRTGRRGGRVAVLFVDLDNFKVVNDSLGHEAGDRLLAAVAGRLRVYLRPEDTLARFGGDEFVLLLEDVWDVDQATRVAKRLLEGLREPFVVDGYELFATLSIGVVFATSPHARPNDLLRQADIAMYKAKEKGKARYEVFEPSMNEVMKRTESESDLRRALNRDEFEVHYQPEVLLETGRIVGLEALVRWEHPELGLVSPAEFIPLAEESGLIVPIGRWVIGEACRQAREWQDLYPSDPPLRVYVNVSGRQFQYPGLAQDVARALRETRLAPETLDLEITENVLVGDTPSKFATVRQLKRLGVKLILDDFGTGYSSLSYLKRLPVDFLKIDHSFVAGLGKDPEDEGIVSTVIALAQVLHMEVIAEGVETAEQAARLQSLDCHFAQGYHFSRPLPAEAAGTLLAGGGVLGS